MLPAFRAETFASIEDIAADVWDSALCGREPLLSHRFLRVCERSHIENTRYRYLVVRDDHGVVAVTSFARLDIALDTLAAPVIRRMVLRLREHYPRFLRQPVLLCGMPVSLGQAPVGIRPGADRTGRAL